MSNEDRAALLQLQWAAQALALDPEEQFALFPDFVDKPFELVDDFDNWFRATQWRPLGFSPQQIALLEELQEVIAGLSDADMWEPAVRTAPSWANLRRVARSVLQVFGWPAGPPPTGRSAYVRASS